MLMVLLKFGMSEWLNKDNSLTVDHMLLMLLISMPQEKL